MGGCLSAVAGLREHSAGFVLASLGHENSAAAAGSSFTHTHPPQKPTTLGPKADGLPELGCAQIFEARVSSQVPVIVLEDARFFALFLSESAQKNKSKCLEN